MCGSTREEERCCRNVHGPREEERSVIVYFKAGGAGRRSGAAAFGLIRQGRRRGGSDRDLREEEEGPELELLVAVGGFDCDPFDHRA